jgi:hypothetical protein
MAAARSSLLLAPLLVLLLAMMLAVTAFVPAVGASVGPSSRNGRLATAFWGLGNRGGGSGKAALTRLMATRGGVAGGKVSQWVGSVDRHVYVC